MELNEAQQQAVTHTQGPCMVLAGPGSGKTFTLVKRIIYMTEQANISPQEILVITFTKAAAREMKERYLKATNKQKTPITFGTFHAVFYGILKWAYHIDAANIMSDEEKKRLVKEELSHCYIEWDDAEGEEEDILAGVLEDIGAIKNNRLRVETFVSKHVRPDIFRKIYNSYERKRKEMKKLDFDDMLVSCLELFEKYPDILKQWQKKFRYLMIDEFQDINPVQYKIVQLLAEPEQNLFIVGDDDQSIYEFRGARPGIMLGFQKDYPKAKEIFLNKNYRSTKKIVTAASRVVSHNAARFPKIFEAVGEAGEDVHVQETKDAAEESRYILGEVQRRHQIGIPYKDMAVLFRTSLSVRTFVECCTEYHIPFQMKEYIPNIYEHFIARDLAAYLRLAKGSRERSDFLMILNRPKRYLARNSLEKAIVSFEDMMNYYCDKEWMQKRIRQLEYDIHQMQTMTPEQAIKYIRKKIGYDEFLKEYAEEKHSSLSGLTETLDYIQEQAAGHQTIEEWFTFVQKYTEELKEQREKGPSDEDELVLLTMHGAKGLEYDTVFIIGANEDEIPYKKAKTPAAIEEERRMFYVAMTRAKRKLFVTYRREKNGKRQSPSRFLSELLFDV